MENSNQVSDKQAFLESVIRALASATPIRRPKLRTDAALQFWKAGHSETLEGARNIIRDLDAAAKDAGIY